MGINGSEGMKVRPGKHLLLVLLMLAAAAACGNPREEARVKLAQMQVSYTPEALVKKAARGEVPAVKLFLRAGMDPGTRDQNGMTPLHAASLGGRSEVAGVLLEAGADPEARDKKLGATVLIHAALRGHKDTVKLLLDRGVKVEAADAKNGRTALMWAVLNNHRETVEILLDRGAALGAQDHYGRNAMIYACTYLKPETVDLLLARGRGQRAVVVGHFPFVTRMAGQFGP